MKAILSLALVLGVCGLAGAADEKVVVGQTHGIHSAVLKEERNYRVYLPDSYHGRRTAGIRSFTCSMASHNSSTPPLPSTISLRMEKSQN